MALSLIWPSTFDGDYAIIGTQPVIASALVFV
jgi:hypothetical protein